MRVSAPAGHSMSWEWVVPPLVLRGASMASSGLARGNGVVPPRTDISRLLVVAVHHIDRDAAAGFCDRNAQIARLLAAFRRQPGAVVAPEARAFGALVGLP